MAPNPAQSKNSKPQLSSLDGSLSRAVDKFANEVAHEKKANGPIKAVGALSDLRDSLREYPKANTKISAINISKLVDILDNHGRNICGNLEPPIFSALVGAMLQGNGCRDAQHGVCLFATSLYEQSRDSKNRRLQQKRQDLIGGESLLLLLNYFVDGSKPVSMRRWVIILGHQLLLGSEKNRANLELGPDQLRHKIGPLMVDETNDHIRVLCGQLVKDLVTSGIPLKNLFPINYNVKIYEGFPGSTQGNKGWSALFENWVGDIYSKFGQLQNTMDLHFGAGFSISPAFEFGDIERNVYVLVVDDELSVLALVSDKNMENILDIPLRSIHHMTVDYQAHSQNQGYANIMLEIKSNQNTFCYLNAVPSKVESIHMSVELSSVKRLKGLFSQACPGFKVTEEFESHEHAQVNRADDSTDREESPMDRQCSSAIDKMPLQSKLGIPSASQSQDPIQIDRKSMQRYTVASKAQPTKGSTIKEQNLEVSHSLHLTDHESKASSKKDVIVGESDPVGSILQLQEQEQVQATKIQNKKLVIKPKAKRPIVSSRKKSSPDAQNSMKEIIAAGSQLSVGPKKLAAVRALAMNRPKTEPLEQSLKSTSASRPSSNAPNALNSSAQSKTNTKSSNFRTTNGLRSKSGAVRPKPVRKALVESDGDYDEICDEGSLVTSIPEGKAGKTSIAPITDNKSKPTLRGRSQLASSTDKGKNGLKRYGLYKKKEDNSNVYEISDDDNHVDFNAIGKVQPKDEIMAKPRNSSGRSMKKTRNGKKTAAKRQSAPALLQQHSAGDYHHTDKQLQKSGNNEDATGEKSAVAKSVDSSIKNVALEMAPEDDNEKEPIDEKTVARGNPNEACSAEISSRGASQTIAGAPGNQQANANIQTAVVEMANKLESLLELEYMEELGPKMPSISRGVSSRNEDSKKIIGNDLVVTRCLKSPENTGSGQVSDVETVYGNDSNDQTQNPVPQKNPDNLHGEALVTPIAKRKSKAEDCKKPAKRRSVENHHHSSQQSSPSLHARSEQGFSQPGSGFASSIETFNSNVAKDKAKDTSDHRNRLSGSTLIDDHLARKQQMISFDEHGPRNQGLSSNQRLLSNISTGQKIDANIQSPVAKQTPILKRKRCETKVMEASLSKNDLPAERSSLSPPRTTGNAADDDQKPIFYSSPPSRPNIFGVRLPLTRRTSSRASRVNTNGSPVASPSIPKVDHIDKLRKKLFEDLHDQYTFTDSASDGKVLKRPRSLSQIFGPQLTLEGQPKARPSSPQELVERYVPHKKTAKGAYEDVVSKDLVEVQKTLADPFNAKGRKTTFTDRLGLRVTEARLNTDRLSTGKHQMEELLDSDALTGSSTDRSSEVTRTPEAAPLDNWNMALRPHYTMLADAVHRVADEVIIQLAAEEDKMGLLAKDYEEKGAKLLKTFEQRRKEQQSLVVENLEQRKVQILSLYRNSKQFVQEIPGEYARSPVAEFEKHWRMQQSVIRDKIAANICREG